LPLFRYTLNSTKDMPTYYKYKLDDGTTLLIEGTETKGAYRSARDEEQIVKTKMGFTQALQGAELQAKLLLKEVEELQVAEAEINLVCPPPVRLV
jgi:hypothetical protein